jgi:large subunit ribosomal protein L28
MARKCIFTGKRPNVANNRSHSNIQTKKRQIPNLQVKRLWWTEGNRFITVRLTTRAMRSVDKLGLQVYADKVGVDLSAF